MNYRKIETAQFVYLLAMTFVIAAAAFQGGCGSDGSTGPGEPVGKYTLNGTATVDDHDDVGSHAGIKLTVLNGEASVGSTRTNSDGSFVLPPLGNGDYTVKASKDFYSTLSKDIQVRDSLLVDPLGSFALERTFFLHVRTDSLNYTFKSDSVFVWMVLENRNIEALDLSNPLDPYPYDFVVIDTVEEEEEIWLWSAYRPPIPLPPRNKYEASIPAMDSLLIYPPGDVRAWGKADKTGSRVDIGYYDIEGRIRLRDDLGSLREFKSKRHVVRLVP
jgi:hypothetical protein